MRVPAREYLLDRLQPIGRTVNVCDGIKERTSFSCCMAFLFLYFCLVLSEDVFLLQYALQGLKKMEDFMHHFLYGDGEPEVTAEDTGFPAS